MKRLVLAAFVLTALTGLAWAEDGDGGDGAASDDGVAVEPAGAEAEVPVDPAACIANPALAGCPAASEPPVDDFSNANDGIQSTSFYDPASGTVSNFMRPTR